MVTLARSSLVTHLLDLVERRAPAHRPWLRELADATEVHMLEAAFAEASRRVGAAPLALDAVERSTLAALGVDWSLQAWRVDDVVRVALLVALAQRAPASLDGLIDRWRHGGDVRQRTALLRALPLLPDPQQWLAVALDARRGDVRAVLEALVCDNPYPAAHFHEVHFDDLVVTALEAELPVSRIVGLRARVSERLRAAAGRVAAARRAAGRRPPDGCAELSWSLA